MLGNFSYIFVDFLMILCKTNYVMNSQNKQYPISISMTNLENTEIHHHVEYEILYLKSGKCIFTVNNNEKIIRSGEIIFIYPGIKHCVKKISEKGEFITIIFDSSVFGEKDDSTRIFFETLKIKNFLNLSGQLLKQIEYIEKIDKKNDFTKEFHKKTLLMQIISYAVETDQYKKTSPLNAGFKKSVCAIDNAINYIKQHFAENITLEEVLETSNYSKSHFIRLFKDCTGMSVTTYINKYRIEKACLNLIYTNKNITEIATENGFNNIQYFSRIFKNYMNCTPKEYKHSEFHNEIPTFN